MAGPAPARAPRALHAGDARGHVAARRSRARRGPHARLLLEAADVRPDAHRPRLAAGEPEHAPRPGAYPTGDQLDETGDEADAARPVDARRRAGRLWLCAPARSSWPSPVSPSAGAIARRAVRATAARRGRTGADDLAPVGQTAQRVPPKVRAHRRRTSSPASATARGWCRRRGCRTPAGSRWARGDRSGVVDAARGRRGRRPAVDDDRRGTRLARFNEITAGSGSPSANRCRAPTPPPIVDTWTDVDGDDLGRRAVRAAPVTIGSGAYLGCNSTVCPGVTVGRGAYVGEGAVVSTTSAEHSVVYGNPAVMVRRYDRASGIWLGVAR